MGYKKPSMKFEVDKDGWEGWVEMKLKPYPERRKEAGQLQALSLSKETSDKLKLADVMYEMISSQVKGLDLKHETGVEAKALVDLYDFEVGTLFINTHIMSVLSKGIPTGNRLGGTSS